VNSILNEISAGLAAMSGWEAAAVLLGIAYLLLAMRENIWCWAAAAISTAIYLVIFWDVGLLMEAALQVYYLVMAAYGWYHWRYGVADKAELLPIERWTARWHFFAITGIVVLSSASGYLLSQHTEARLPYIDSFTTWASILTTWMVARKILENWLYWIVIDTVSIGLYLDRALYLTVLMFALYVIIAVFGFRGWHRHWVEEQRAKA